MSDNYFQDDKGYFSKKYGQTKEKKNEEKREYLIIKDDYKKNNSYSKVIGYVKE